MRLVKRSSSPTCSASRPNRVYPLIDWTAALLSHSNFAMEPLLAACFCSFPNVSGITRGVVLARLPSSLGEKTSSVSRCQQLVEHHVPCWDNGAVRDGGLIHGQMH